MTTPRRLLGQLGQRGRRRSETPAREEAAQRLLGHARELQQETRAAMDATAAERFVLEGRIIELNHALRTPLASVLGYLELLLDGDFGPLTQEQVEVLGRIDTAARHFQQSLGAFSVESIVEEAGGR